MKKPYRIITYYTGASELRQKLNSLGVKFTEQDVLNNFWGKEFRIEKPTGKGAHEKMRQIDRL